MAKKKTATTKAVPALKNTVRNAVNRIWRVVNRLDDDNIIGITYNANTKEFSAVNEVTGEELSGGGGSGGGTGLPIPALKINVEYPEGSENDDVIFVFGPGGYNSDPIYLFENNGVYKAFNAYISDFTLADLNNIYILIYGESENMIFASLTIEPTNMVNCNYTAREGLYYVSPIDPTQPASLTVAYWPH